MSRLVESLRAAPVVERDDGYQYFVHPVCDGVPAVDPALLREVAVRVVRAADVAAVDKIVTPAAMGIHITTAVSLVADVPFVVVRKRAYGLEGETAVAQQTGYGGSEMYVNDVDPGDRVLVLDDVLSTGGTLTAILGALDDRGAEVVDVVSVVRKVDADGDHAGDRLGDHDVTALVDVRVVDGRVEVVAEHDTG